MNDAIAKAPPYSIEAEQAVLGGLMIDSASFDKIDGLIAEADFFRRDHRTIFSAIATLAGRGKSADVVMVAEYLDTRGELEEVGGIAYLGGIAGNTPSAANIKSYAGIVRKKATLRAVMTAAASLHMAAADEDAEAATNVLAEAENALAALSGGLAGGGEPVRLHDAVFDVLNDVDERRQRGGRLSGLLTGFRRLDEMTGGLEPGQLIIVAARPSVGKSVLACGTADHVSRHGGAVLLHSLEMSTREIAQRIVAARSGVPVAAMRGGTSDNQAWDRLGGVYGGSAGDLLFIDDTPAVTVAQVRAKAKAIKRRHGLALIVIDYLQLMRGTGDNRTQEIGSISRGLKGLAKELNAPIIALAQLNRGVEARADKRPLMSDLRDSGEIEQDADIVAMLHREELSNQAPQWRGLAELIVRKNRNGPTGECLLKFEQAITRFSDYDGPAPSRLSAVPRSKRGFSE